MEILFEVFFFIIGWLYLFIRYRDRKKMKQVLIEKYEDSYTEVGRTIISDTAFILWGLLLIGALLLVIFISIRSIFI